MLRQVRLCCVLTLLVGTLRSVRLVCPVPRRHILLRPVRLETRYCFGFPPDTCIQATLPPMHPDSDLNTIEHQD